MKAAWVGSEQRPYRLHGVPQSHADMLRTHVANLDDERAKLDSYDGHECEGDMVLHGELEVREDGTTFPVWDGDALFHTVVCLECGDEWCVESDYRRVKIGGVAGIEVEAEDEDIPW